ncbi:hypothetical protein JXB28_03845 [Candidatus Woesearchaeota archaeon]|nr:hypothetical protein [Candidatus Woesearchaeota archaeon]
MLNKSFLPSILAFGLFCSLLLMPACSSGKPVFMRLEGFLGGNEGLRVTVLPGAPPSVVQDRGITPFSFVVSLENAGEMDVGPGTDNPFVLVRLVGIMHSNFGLTPETAAKTLQEPLQSAMRNYDGSMIPGEIAYISFDNLAYKPDVADNLALNIRTEVCYDYETKANVKFCMKNDLIESSVDATICEIRGYKPLGTSGAPIQITGVWEDLASDNTIRLNILIENVGGGIFFLRPSETSNLLSACDPTERNPDAYRIEVSLTPAQEGDYEINCPRFATQTSSTSGLGFTGGSSGILRMYGGSPVTLSCFVTKTSPSTIRVYEDMINIKLRYRYAEFLEVPLLIQGYI